MKKYSTVDEFLDDLDPPRKELVIALRPLILASANGLSEHIKWNAPSYALNGEDRITFNTFNKDGAVKIILHMGALRKEDKKGEPILKGGSDLIVWQSDIRGTMSFGSVEEIKKRQAEIKDVITQWLELA